MTITEQVNPISAVAGGTPPGTQGQYIEDKKGECGLIIPAIDGIVDKITGWSLLEALFKPVAGDFNAVSQMQLAWGNVGNACAGVGQNYTSLGQQLPGVWQGPAADAATSRMADIGEMHADQQEASGYIAEQLGHVIEVGKATLDVLVIAIDFIDGIIQELIVSALAGPIGWLKAGVTAPGKARRVIELIHDGLRAIEKLTRAAEALLKVLRYVNAGLGGANTVLTAISTAQHADVANRTDDSADQGF
ncbi:hypothetical protein SAMN05192575_107194 [Nocardioides alpinus]|uniref:Proteins of 100 residues with WXG n=1 Tax=Nocardioides alpinus TaxID=748909 RepID=A0A1I1A3G1_9ACTN|nr:hypothetical protein [Nocardioides alpinus]PKH42122.1 hypothetical protein CXG46_06485 [Nocardioides alpinus]SFB32554.1 hypothetical protein SAMN05192575_107194 [Nocardioides alpinus]